MPQHQFVQLIDWVLLVHLRGCNQPKFLRQWRTARWNESVLLKEHGCWRLRANRILTVLFGLQRMENTPEQLLLQDQQFQAQALHWGLWNRIVVRRVLWNRNHQGPKSSTMSTTRFLTLIVNMCMLWKHLHRGKTRDLCNIHLGPLNSRLCSGCGATSSRQKMVSQWLQLRH